jgi:hypothetical protein
VAVTGLRADVASVLREASDAERIRLLTWHLILHENRDAVSSRDIEAAYRELHLNVPASVSASMRAMVGKSLRRRGVDRYVLSRSAIASIEKRFTKGIDAPRAKSALLNLRAAISTREEISYYNEVLACLQADAFRAAIVMTWNLCYFHFIGWLFDKHISSFNNELVKSMKHAAVTTPEAISYLSEDLVLTTARKSRVVSNSLHKVLKEKLDRRNAVAHPSTMVIHRETAEEYVIDLVSNAIVHLK